MARKLLTLVAALLAVTPLSHSRSASDDSDYPIANQVSLTAPFDLACGELDFLISVPGYAPIEFRALAIPLSGYPQSLLVPASPLGVGALLKVQPGVVGHYVLAFEAMGELVPLSWSSATSSCSGTSGGGIDASVQQAPQASSASDDAPQGPAGQGPGGGPTCGIGPATDATGAQGVKISLTADGECEIGFLQFVSVKITWKGTKPNGDPASGTGAGPQKSKANGGLPMQTDGSRTYVDAPTPGDPIYPHHDQVPGPGAGQSTGSMYDAPGLRDPKPLVDDIEQQNPGVQVTEITVEQRFTAYAWRRCPNQAAKILYKIEWSRSQTVPINPDNTGPAGGPDGFGGPLAEPPTPGSPFTNGQPNVQPADKVDPEHDAAMWEHTLASGEGAPVQGW